MGKEKINISYKLTVLFHAGIIPINNIIEFHKEGGWVLITFVEGPHDRPALVARQDAQVCQDPHDTAGGALANVHMHHEGQSGQALPLRVGQLLVPNGAYISHKLAQEVLVWNMETVISQNCSKSKKV